MQLVDIIEPLSLFEIEIVYFEGKEERGQNHRPANNDNEM